MASPDNELESQLMEAGSKLMNPPSSVDELLPLLDKVESCLQRVEQSPTKSMQNALSPFQKALGADKLLRHSDIDVKVAVASCMSEITRITAPEAPYNDDQMKEAFQLIVLSFENLDDNSSRSYGKRTTILETVAKVRSCVVMLDLECDALILQMFQHFLRAIRDYHPENVFSSMEIIMTLVLEESEDIPLELLSLILATVKKDNEDVLPITRKLGERVLENCASKLKPYLIQAVETNSIVVDDYSKVLASICQDAVDTGQNGVQASGEHKVDESKTLKASGDEGEQESKGAASETSPLGQVVHAVEESSKSVVDNGVKQTGENDSLAHSNSLKKQDSDHPIENSKELNARKVEHNILGNENTSEKEQVPEQSTKRRGKNSSSTAPADRSYADNEIHNEELPDQKCHGVDDHALHSEGVVPSENNKESDIKLSPSKTLENESTDVVSASPTRSHPDETSTKKSRRSKKKDSSDKDTVQSEDDASKKVADGTIDSEVKSNKLSGEKLPSVCSDENKTSNVVVVSVKENNTSDSETKPTNQSARKVGGSNKNNDVSSSKHPLARKNQDRGKDLTEEDMPKVAAKDEKEMISSPKSTKDEQKSEVTPKTSAKRKHPPVKVNDPDNKGYGEQLVGYKIKVWWPADKQYYEGVIDSYDHVKRKHKVLYTDGEQEVLSLTRERWEFIDLQEGEETGGSSQDSYEMPLEKKLKTNSNEHVKGGKTDASSKRSGGASASISRGMSSNSGRPSKEGSKVDGKSKDDSKSVSKPENETSGKSKVYISTSDTGNSANVAQKRSSKSKNADYHITKTTKLKGEASTPSTTKSKKDVQKAGKSKQGTPKTPSVSKGKSSQSGGKSNANGIGKAKYGSSKIKETDDVKEHSSDSGKVPESTKGKSPNSLKAQGNEAKLGKKRKKKELNLSSSCRGLIDDSIISTKRITSVDVVLLTFGG